MPADFEKWLSEELHKELDPLKSVPTSTHPWYRRFSLQSWSRPLSMLPVTAVRGLVVAGMVAALSTTGTFALAAAATHSANPLVWGQQVQSAVRDCKDQLASGQHGIGECVSDFAQTHGAKSDEHSSLHSPEPSESDHPESDLESGATDKHHSMESPESTSSPAAEAGHTSQTPEPSQTSSPEFGASQSPCPSSGCPDH